MSIVFIISKFFKISSMRLPNKKLVFVKEAGV